MFSLIKEIYSLCQKKPIKEINVMIVGIDQNGKTYFQEYFTSMLQQKEVKQIYDIRTIGVNTTKLPYADYQMCLWDIGGSDSIRNVWKRYLNETNVILYCIDSSDEQRLNESFTALSELMLEDNRNLSVCVLLTKADILNKNVELAVESFAKQNEFIMSIKQISIMNNDGLVAELEDIAEWCIQYAKF